MTLMTTTVIPPPTSLDCPFCLAVHARTIELNLAAASLRDFQVSETFQCVFLISVSFAKSVYFIFEKRNSKTSLVLACLLKAGADP